MLHWSRLFLGAVISLWVVDVSVNLLVWRESVLGRVVHGGYRDHLGLLLGETQIALGFVILSVGVSAALARASGTRGAGPGAFGAATSHVALGALAGLVSAMAVFSVLGAHLRDGDGDPAIAFPVAVVVGVALGALAARRARRRACGIANVGEIVSGVCVPALIAGFGTQAAGYALSGSRRAIISIGFAAAVALLAWSVDRARSRRPALAAAWLLVLVSGALVIRSAHGSNRYGQAGAQPTPAIAARDVEGASPGARGPDVVLIVLDTARADHLELHGYRRNTMPFLERWAGDAMVFNRAVSAAGWTAPAHASLLSGQPVSVHGVHYATGGHALATGAYDGISWLPERLADSGYHCVAVSANHLAIPRGVSGFARVLVPTRPRWHDATMAGLVDDLSPLLSRLSERLRWRMPYADAAEVVDIVMRALPDTDAPLFLFVNVMDTHSPYNPPSRAQRLLGVSPGHRFGRYRTHRSLTRASGLPPGAREDLVDLYDAELRWMDANLERLITWLGTRLGEDTIVIVTSDHGEELGEEGRVGHEYGLSQRLVHVPLVIRGPGVPAGEVDDVVSLRSVPGFILAAAAGDVDLDVFTRPDDFGVLSERYPSAYNARTLGPGYQRAWVSRIENGYKGVGPSRDGFDLSVVSGPGFIEEAPSADEPGRAAIADSLRAWIDGYWETFRDRREADGASREATEEHLRLLRSLGYID